MPAISKRWREPVAAYLRWRQGRHGNDFGFGAVQFVKVERNIWVATMIAQRRKIKGVVSPIRYDAVERCLSKVGEKSLETGSSAHMPIGCGLADDQWDLIEPLIIRTLCEKDIAVSVYHV